MQSLSEIIDKKIKKLEYGLGLIEDVPCTKEQNKQFESLEKSGQPLPANVKKSEYGDYVTAVRYEDAEKEKKLLAYQLYSDVRTIKNCAVFFTVLTAVSLAAGVIALIAAFS